MLFSYNEIKKSHIYYTAFVLLHYWIAFVVFVGIFIMSYQTVDLSSFINKSDIESIKKRLFKLSFPEPNTGCFIWCAATYTNGYGYMTYNKKSISAHRLSYFIHKGIIPAGLVVDHLCNNKYCINPEHLEVKTQRENTLRSSSISAINAAKTHCDNGHPYENNVRINKRGSRDCLICLTAKKKRHYDKNLDSILKKKAEYYKKNRSRIRETQTLYYQSKKNG